MRMGEVKNWKKFLVPRTRTEKSLEEGDGGGETLVLVPALNVRVQTRVNLPAIGTRRCEMSGRTDCKGSGPIIGENAGNVTAGLATENRAYK